VATVAARQRKTSESKKQEQSALTLTGLLMEGDYTPSKILSKILSYICIPFSAVARFGCDCDLVALGHE